jgi:hypothetical protein
MVWLACAAKVPDKVWAMEENPPKSKQHKRVRLLFIWGLDSNDLNLEG